jgi:tellurite resistance protein TerC
MNPLSRRTTSQSPRSALIAAAAWTLAGIAFAPVVLLTAGSGEMGHYLSVFALEKTLSLDNVAMFAVVLGATQLPAATANRVLTGGLLGALVLRVAFIVAGLAVVDAVHAVMLGFAIVLVVSGVRMMRPSPGAPGAPNATASRWLPAPIRSKPAAAALVAIMAVDVAFAADSILAAFAVTTSAFPIIAANVFAVLGLRPLYVVLVGALERFRYLQTGIGVLLVGIGIELGVEHFVGVPSWVTLASVGACLLASIGASLAAEHGLTPRRLIRRIGITVAGFTLLLAGAAMLVLPGPGVLVIVGGLAVLATEYAWAARPLAAMRRRLRRRRSAPDS